jgi:hypothetical protein
MGWLHRQEWLDRLGVWITQGVATMWCAVIFLIIALVSLPAAIASHDAYVIVSWISQSFLQLVLLPIIMVGQKVLGAQIAPLKEHHEANHNKLSDIIAMLEDLKREQE